MFRFFRVLFRLQQPNGEVLGRGKLNDVVQVDLAARQRLIPGHSARSILLFLLQRNVQQIWATFREMLILKRQELQAHKDGIGF